MDSVAEFRAAVIDRADRWVPACGGTEVPFPFEGRRWLYVFNPARGLHGYLCLDTDIVMDTFHSDDDPEVVP